MSAVRGLSLALVSITAWTSVALAQPVPEPPPPDPAPPPSEAPPAAPPAEEPVPPLDGPREETLDESNGVRTPPPKAGPPASADEEFCGACVLVAGAVAVLVAAVPLAAEADGASRTRDTLAQWVRDQGASAGDLGFIVGYGFAKQELRQERFTIAASITGGIGGAALIAGVIWLAVDGRIPGIGAVGPARRVGSALPVRPTSTGLVIDL